MLRLFYAFLHFCRFLRFGVVFVFLLSEERKSGRLIAICGVHGLGLFKATWGKDSFSPQDSLDLSLYFPIKEVVSKPKAPH